MKCTREVILTLQFLNDANADIQSVHTVGVCDVLLKDYCVM